MHAHLNAGSKCTIWNRSPGREFISSLQATGINYGQHLEKAIHASDFLIAYSPDHESVHECFDTLPSTKEAHVPFSKLRAIID